MNICMMLWALDFVFLAAAYHYVRLNSKGGWECFSSVTGYRPARWVAGLLYGLFFIVVAVIGIISTHTILSHMWHTATCGLQDTSGVSVRHACGQSRSGDAIIAVGHPGSLTGRERVHSACDYACSCRSPSSSPWPRSCLVATQLLRRVLTPTLLSKTWLDMRVVHVYYNKQGCFLGPRLDPFGAAPRHPPKAARPIRSRSMRHEEEHDRQGLDTHAEAELGERRTDEPALDLEPVEAVDTGCAECGGMGNKKSDPVQELRTEMAAIGAPCGLGGGCSCT